MNERIIEERRKRGVIGWVFLVGFWGFNAIMALMLFAGVASVQDMPAAASEAERAGQAVGSVIGVGMILAIWGFGVVILGAMVMLTRGRKIIVERSAS